jgi:MscS family membrane protein
MPNVLERVYLGNTLLDWIIALAIMAGALVAAKMIFWFFRTVVSRFTSRTKTSLDDIIVDMVEEPLVFIVAAVGIWIGIRMLTLPSAVDKWVAIIVQILVVLAVGWMVTRLLDALYKQYVIPFTENSETDLDDQLAPLIRKAVKFIIWGITIVIALNNAGYDVGALLAGLGIGGLALAMAAKDTVTNVFGGFTIFTDRPFTLKDRIEIEGHDGVVEDIGIRSTRIRTLKGRLVTIPNSSFTDAPVVNISSEPSRKVSMELGLTYDTPPEQMKQALQLLQEIVAAQPDTEEKVLTGFTEFGDSAMTILLIYYVTRGGDILGTKTAINLEILTRFNASGLEMAYPTRTLYTKALN